MDKLRLEPRTTILGAGIYIVGSNHDRMFVTDSGKLIAVTGRIITEEDLLKAYRWGREDECNNPYTEEEPQSEVPEVSEILCHSCGHGWGRHIDNGYGFSCRARDIDASGNWDGCGCGQCPPPSTGATK